MRPRVIVHNGTSLDGRMDWASDDPGLYYEIAARFQVDAMLAGSETMLVAYKGQQDHPAQNQLEEDARELVPNPVPFLAIVDSRGRIKNWGRIRREPYWKSVLALCSHATPPAHLDDLQTQRIEHIVAGNEHVDLRAALEMLYARFAIRSVRVDSGGVLNGVLLRAGLVDEVSVLVNPFLVGGTSPRSIFVAPDLKSAEGASKLELTHLERLRDDVVWLKYAVVK